MYSNASIRNRCDYESEPFQLFAEIYEQPPRAPLALSFGTRALVFGSVISAIWIGHAPAASLVVTNANDSGPGSLRQAILSANASLNVPDTISFNITGAGPFTITP